MKSKFLFISSLCLLLSCLFLSCNMNGIENGSNSLKIYKYGIYEDYLVSGKINSKSTQVFLNSQNGTFQAYTPEEIEFLMNQHDISYADILTLLQKYTTDRRIENVEKEEMPEPIFTGDYCYLSSDGLIFSVDATDSQEEFFQVNKIDLNTTDEQPLFTKIAATMNMDIFNQKREDAYLLNEKKSSVLSDADKIFKKYQIYYDVERELPAVIVNNGDYDFKVTADIIGTENMPNIPPYITYVYRYEGFEEIGWFKEAYDYIDKALELNSKKESQLIFDSNRNLKRFFDEVNEIARDDSDIVRNAYWEYADNLLADAVLDFSNIKVINVQDNVIYHIKNVKVILPGKLVESSVTGLHPLEFTFNCTHTPTKSESMLTIGIREEGLDVIDYGTRDDISERWFMYAYHYYNLEPTRKYKNLSQFPRTIEENIAEKIVNDSFINHF